MSRTRATILRPGCWYADCRGGDLTSFLRFEGHSPDKKILFFVHIAGFPSAYPLVDDHYQFKANPEIEWFIPNDEDIKKWDLD